MSPHAGAPRSALLAAWGSAWLAGEASLPDLLDRVSAADDEHTVAGLADEPLPLEKAVARLRADGAVRLRVLLPAPGDALGLPAPGPFTAAALAASEGVLALRPNGTGRGLVPAVTAHGSPFDGTVTTVCWTAYDAERVGPEPGPFLHDAEHDLRRGVVTTARVLNDLDVARWRPEAAAALRELRLQPGAGIDDDELPGCFDSRARELLAQARRLGGVLQLAAQDAGAAVDSHETTQREAALRELAGQVRRARVAAYNSFGATG